MVVMVADFGCGFWLWKWVLVVWPVIVDVFVGSCRFMWL